MMSHRWSQAQLNACSIFHALGRGDLVQIADMLSRVSDDQFEAVLNGFRAYRQATLDQGPTVSGPEKKHRRAA